MRMLGRVVLGMVVALFALGSVAEAQTPPKELPNTFETEEACRAALKSGQCRFYEPKYFGLKSQNPVNGKDRVVVPLETDMCLRMCVVGGKQFVAQREGTNVRVQKLADGSLSIYARDDCGNCAEGTLLPRERPTTTMVEPKPEIVPEIVGPEPPQSWRARYEPTRREEQPPTRKKDSHWKKWGAIVGGGVLVTAGVVAYEKCLWPFSPGKSRRR